MSVPPQCVPLELLDVVWFRRDGKRGPRSIRTGCPPVLVSAEKGKGLFSLPLFDAKSEIVGKDTDK